VMLKTAATEILRENGRVVGVKAKQFGEPFEIRATVTVGADGFESQLGRWAGLPTNIAMRDMDSCLQYRMTNVDCDVRYCDFYLGEVAPGGYVWVFPKAEGLANVGIGSRGCPLSARGRMAAAQRDGWGAEQQRQAWFGLAAGSGAGQHQHSWGPALWAGPNA
ncbi:MAG: hypothetical protein ABSE84_28580, partial [Isosphaeraceae bacterium]